MSPGMAPSWFSWVEARLREQFDKIENIERTLATFKTQQRRMLYGLIILGVVVLGDILL
tara:strand:- start:576 stop:752 length:177 start_codon:yes stop_codon:yes gene_type:complete